MILMPRLSSGLAGNHLLAAIEAAHKSGAKVAGHLLARGGELFCAPVAKGGQLSCYEHLDCLPKGKSALTKALELNPANVSARLAFARLLMQFEYDWAGAETEYQRAIEVSPNSADAHFQYSEYLRKVDRRTEGDKEFDLAQSLNPAHDYFAEPS
jgi:tetratricopeptide (TPR) repeat protein